jgi:hypothetical protein
VAYEVLVDEKGEVECALALEGTEGVPPCVLKATTVAVSYYRFTVPKNKEGRACACYCTLRVSPGGVESP